MHQEMFLLLAREHMRDLMAGAEQERRHTKPRRDPLRPASAAQVTLRVDRVWDSVRLHELAKLAGRRLPDDSFVVAEVDGQVAAALPLGGGQTLTDPAVDTKQLLPLLELRAAQIRRVAMRRRAAWRSRLRRA